MKILWNMNKPLTSSIRHPSRWFVDNLPEAFRGSEKRFGIVGSPAKVRPQAFFTDQEKNSLQTGIEFDNF